jgi:hypothetical protein
MLILAMNKELFNGGVVRKRKIDESGLLGERMKDEG